MALHMLYIYIKRVKDLTWFILVFFTLHKPDFLSGVCRLYVVCRTHTGETRKIWISCKS